MLQRHSSGTRPVPIYSLIPLLLLCGPAPQAKAQEPTVATPVAGAPQTNEQPPVKIRRVQVRGNQVITTEAITALILKRADRPATLEWIQQVVNDVKAHYRQRGFTMAQVTDIETAADGQLNIVIAEGVIRRVTIKGNTRTRNRTILQVLSVGPGSVYNEKTIQRDRLRLSRLGIFADISIAPRVAGAIEREEKAAQEASDKAQKPDPLAPKPATMEPVSALPLTPPEDTVGQIDLLLLVKDQPTVNVAATVGYTDTIGAVGFLDLSESNLLGTGHRIGVEWQRTAQTQIQPNGTLQATDSRSAAGFSYEIPALGLRSIAIGTEIYSRNTVFLPFFAGGRETIRSYERRSGAKARIGKRFTDQIEAYITGRRDIVGYDPVPVDLNPPLAALSNARGTVGALGFTIVADGRNSVDTPDRGFRDEFRFERAAGFFGGNRTFSQMTLDLRQYAPLLRHQAQPRSNSVNNKIGSPVVAVRMLGGYSSGDVPLSEQFFLGGFDLLRGYDLFSVRGDRFALSTAELRIPIGNGLQGVAFTDIGDAWEPGEKASLSSMKASIGLGLRFFSPIGPIRLDAAYGSRLQTYISLGQSF